MNFVVSACRGDKGQIHAEGCSCLPAAVPWMPPEPQIGEWKRYCGTCQKDYPEFAAFVVARFVRILETSEVYSRAADAREGNYLDATGQKFVVTKAGGGFHKIGRTTIRKDVAFPVIRVKDLPDLNNPATVWGAGTPKAIPVAWMNLDHVRNAVAWCERNGRTSKCLPALVARISPRPDLEGTLRIGREETAPAAIIAATFLSTATIAKRDGP